MSDSTVREVSPLQAVQLERANQDTRWGEQNHGDLRWLAILAEEFGEAARAVTELAAATSDSAEVEQWEECLEIELVQTAAVAVAWIESIRRRPDPKPEAQG